jgi:hypothetical protein
MNKTIEINADTIAVETETYLHKFHCPDKWFASGMIAAIVHHIVDTINWELDADYTSPYVIHQWLIWKTLDSRLENIVPDKDYLKTIHNMLDKVTIEIETDKQGHIYINNVIVK